MKSNKSLGRLSLLFFLIFTINASAQRILTLSEAQQLAIDQIKADVAKRQATLAKIEQLKVSTKYPTVNASVTYNRLSNNVDPFKIVVPGGPAEGVVVQPIILNQFQNRLVVNQLLYSGDRTKNALKALELQLQTGDLETEKESEDMRFGVTQLYYELYKLKVTKKLIIENMKLIDENIKDIESAQKQGIALENDVLRLKLQKSNIELSQIDTQNAMESLAFNLNLLMGIPIETAIDTDSASIFQLKNIQSLNAYISDAQKLRHDLKAVNLKKEVAITQIDITKSALKPTIALGGTYFLDNPNQRVFPQNDKFKGTWALGFTATYSISNLWTVKHQVAENQANVDQIESLYQELSDGIKMEINQSYAGFKQISGKVKVAEIAVNQATENYRVTNNRYKEGLITLTELLNANFLVLQSKMNLINTQIDVELAYHRLMKSVNN